MKIKKIFRKKERCSDCKWCRPRIHDHLSNAGNLPLLGECIYQRYSRLLSSDACEKYEPVK